MKRFLTTTATALILSTSAYADAHTSAFSELKFDATTNIKATEFIGMRVYASESDIDNTMAVAEGGDLEWDDIGEINQVILTRDGDIQAVIVGVGGFLGIGEKDVAVDMSQISFVNEEGDTGDYFLVIKAAAAGVQDAPTYDYNLMSNTMDETNERVLLQAPMIDRDGYNQVTMANLNTEDLTGARVYGANDEDVGEISELLLTSNGAIDRAVIDVGGFLGLGERPVAVTMDELTIMRTQDGDEFRVYIDSTQEALEAQPEYQG